MRSDKITSQGREIDEVCKMNQIQGKEKHKVKANLLGMGDLEGGSLPCESRTKMMRSREMSVKQWWKIGRAKTKRPETEGNGEEEEDGASQELRCGPHFFSLSHSITFPIGLQ